MTATRAARFPDLRNGTTLHHISDTHFGTPRWDAYVKDFLNRTLQDMDDMGISLTGGHLHTGDIINWYQDAPGGDSGTDAQRVFEENQYKIWRAQVKTDGLPYAEVCGNHDLMGAAPVSGGTRVPRLASDWAAAMGLPQPSNAYDFGDFRVITLAPDRWPGDVTDPDNQFTIHDPTVDWLQTQLWLDTRPVLLAAHVPLSVQYNEDGQRSVTPGNNPRLYELIGDNSNVIGWLSGHRHNDIRNSQWAEVVTVAGRPLFNVCGPGGGSGRTRNSNAYSLGQYASDVYSSFITVMDENTIDIRFRDHLAKQWSYGATATETHRLLTR